MGETSRMGLQVENTFNGQQALKTCGLDGVQCCYEGVIVYDVISGVRHHGRRPWLPGQKIAESGK